MVSRLEFDSGWVPPKEGYGAQVCEFVWRGELRRAYLCRHPSGFELVDVRLPGRRVRFGPRVVVKLVLAAVLGLALILLLGGCGGRSAGDVSATDARVVTLVAEAKRICGLDLAWDVAQGLAVDLSPARGEWVAAARQVCARYGARR